MVDCRIVRARSHLQTHSLMDSATLTLYAAGEGTGEKKRPVPSSQHSSSVVSFACISQIYQSIILR